MPHKTLILFHELLMFQHKFFDNFQFDVNILFSLLITNSDILMIGFCDESNCCSKRDSGGEKEITMCS